MLKASGLVSGVALSLGLALSAGAALAAPSDVLPLKRVRLYEAGVAYFERSGVPRGTTVLPVPASHLDDALKTVTVLSAGGEAEVRGIELDLRITRARRLALAGLDDTGAAPTFERQIESLRGENVEVTLTDERVVGRLLEIIGTEESSVVRCVQGSESTEDGKTSCVARKTGLLTLLTDRGALRRLALMDVESVRATDPLVVERLRAAFLPGGRSTAPEMLRVDTSSGKPITLGYVAEAPLWRASYRLVLGEADALLQGWALVHNDTDEAWRDVSIELVNGQPDSFLFPLAAPRYAERRLVTPEQHLPSAPQLSRQTPDAMWDEGEGSGGIGYGIGLGSVGAGGHGMGTPLVGVAGPEQSALLDVGDLASQDPTNGEAVGALFRYALSRKVDLDAQKSLLLPFLKESVEVERATLFDDPTSGGRASIVLTNSSTQTLPPGTIALFEGGGFAGESATDRVEPGQRRVLSFGFDLDVHLKSEATGEGRELRFLTYEGGRVHEHFLRRRNLSYSIENRGVRERNVHVSLDTVNNASIEGADSVFVDADGGRTAAVFHVPAGKRQNYSVVVREGLSSSLTTSDLTTRDLRRWLGTNRLPKAQAEALRAALGHLGKHEATLQKRVTMRAEITELDARLQRLTKALAVVRHADSGDAEVLSNRIVVGEERRAQLTRALATLDPYPELARAKKELVRLNAATPKE
jgi:hypothetical protein